jgi:hypothetical protein
MLLDTKKELTTLLSSTLVSTSLLVLATAASK